MHKNTFKGFGLIAQAERRVVLWAFLYFFTLLASYFILRPLRDEMGVANGAINMQWLFTGTFATMMVIVPLFGYATAKFKIAKVLSSAYVFLIINIICFYLLFKFVPNIEVLPAVFFIWLSVFNLFAVSLFWSFMVDIFTMDQSKRLFGVIAAGGSLGAIVGPLVTNLLSHKTAIENLFLVAASFLLISLLALRKLMRISAGQNPKKEGYVQNFSDTFLSKNSILDGIKLVMTSKYLQGMVLFMLLYTGVSTFLYFEQAHIVETLMEFPSHRIAYFSKVDLVTNVLAIGGQLFLTSRIIGKFGLTISLCCLPILIGIGFVALSFNTMLIIIAILVIMHRAGNFMVLRPAREMLYTICSREEKYKAKNFIDTAVYRGGDALWGWAFAGLVSLGLGLSAIAIIALPIIALWSHTGFKLGRNAEGRPSSKISTIKTKR
ncbi:NTP/NDP exchange transporter [Spongiimicrobium sp. 3-5]|uniref:NTP/NDP exchange transporter n=1 Tax=Spongiimicrobium sp. 3-5 TaxID=3332596 RepID=UPI00397E9A25